MRTTKTLPECPDCGSEHMGGRCGMTATERKATFLERVRSVTVDYHPSATVDRHGKGHSTRRGGRDGQRRFDGHLGRLERMAKDGIVPDDMSSKAFDKAERVSEKTQTAYDGAARGRAITGALKGANLV